MHITVVGLGYVGLPLALLASEKGHNVIGVDKNEDILSSIKKKESKILDKFVIDLIENTRLEVTNKVASSEVYIVCVPTPVNSSRDPDLKYVISAIEEIASVIEEEQLVIIESTINPGVCNEIVKPLLDETGKTYYLAHCPERINPGDKKWNVRNIPRVVGGIDKKSGEKAKELYSKIIDAEIELLSQIEAAEATKILENTFRDVNIAFINEMAMSFHKLKINIMEVIKGASTKPFSFLPHFPGVGVGGHCIAVDPYYMINRGKEVGFIHDFLIAARRVNSDMPSFTVSILQDALNEICLPLKNSKVLLLGVSYKSDVADERESPYFEVYNILNSKKAKILTYDPYFMNLSSHEKLKDAIDEADAIVLITAHEEFCDYELYRGVKVFIDGRNIFSADQMKKIVEIYKGIGVSI